MNSFKKFKQIIKISYNCRTTVLNAWNNPNNIIKPNIKNTDEEDEKIIKELSEYNTNDDTQKYFIPIKYNLKKYNSSLNYSE